MSIYLIRHIICFMAFALFKFPFKYIFLFNIQYIVVIVESMHKFIHSLWISPPFH